MEEILNRFRSLPCSQLCALSDSPVLYNGTHDPLVVNSFVDVTSYLHASEELE
jgi:hypothetical protein